MARTTDTRGDKIIDSRDVIARFEELDRDVEALDEDEQEEHKALAELIDQAEGYGDWRYGETLIREDYFEDYAQELAEDIGAIDRNAKWPNTHIDWAAAADELKQDYMEVEFDGTTYYMRS